MPWICGGIESCEKGTTTATKQTTNRYCMQMKDACGVPKYYMGYSFAANDTYNRKVSPVRNKNTAATVGPYVIQSTMANPPRKYNVYQMRVPSSLPHRKTVLLLLWRGGPQIITKLFDIETKRHSDVCL